MSSKAKSAKEEAPLSPTKKGKKATKGNSPKKDPKSPAKVKSVTKAAETPVKTSSKKKAAETPQNKTQGEEDRPLRSEMEEGHVRFPLIYFLSHIYVGASSRSSSPV